MKHKRSVSSSESIPELQPSGTAPADSPPSAAEGTERVLGSEPLEEEKSALSVSRGPSEHSHRLLGGSPLIVLSQCLPPSEDGLPESKEPKAGSASASDNPPPLGGNSRPKPKLLFEDFNERHAEKKKEIQQRRELAKLTEEIAKSL